MKRLLLSFLFLAPMVISKLHAQSIPYIQWQKCLGGSMYETAYSIEQTSDSGYVVAGFAGSTDGDVTGNHGAHDYWIVKLDTSGNIIWEKSYGGSVTDHAKCIQQTKNDGFIVAGTSNSNDGDVSGNHLDTNGYNTSSDYWIINLDSTGNLIWEKSLGGSGGDELYGMDQTSDGGVIVAGATNSNDGDVSGNHGLADYWIVKLDSIGNLVWQKCYGGSNDDEAYSIQQTIDGGFIVAGYTNSNDGNVSGNHGNEDYWILKLDTAGNLQWQKCLGGSYVDEATSIQQTSDGGFIVAGSSSSSDGDVSGNHGADYWIVKIDSSGNLIWQKCLGGTQEDVAEFIQQTDDGGFIVTGRSFSDDGDATFNHGSTDYWVVKTDSVGNLVWQKSLGGSDSDDPYCIQQTTDGGFIVAGLTHSSDGDILGYHGNDDCWIVKLGMHIATGISASIDNSISIFPNPVESKLFINLSAPPDETTIRVCDMQGRIIPLPTNFHHSPAEITTETLLNGFYTLQITNIRTGEIQFTEFVKQ